MSTTPVFEMDSVSVTLEWIPEEGVSYNVAADQAVEFKAPQGTIVNLTVLYNIPTSLNITATSCGQNNETAITSIEFAYVDHH